MMTTDTRTSAAPATTTVLLVAPRTWARRAWFPIALVALPLAACREVEIVPEPLDEEDLQADACVCESPAPPPEPEPPSLYARQADTPVLAGEMAVAVARCDGDDAALSGGCVWGKEAGTALAHESFPELDAEGRPVGWRCSGLAGDHDNHVPVYATVVCVVGDAG